MSEAIQPLQPASATNLASNLRNPLVIYGLILLAGDGPLVIAYALTQDPARAWVLLVATIVFIFAMAAFFCYLVAFKPRHLYAPTEIPEKAFGRSIYQDPQPVRRILKDAQSIAANINTAQTDTERRSLSENLSDQLTIVNQLQAAYDMLLIPGYDLSLISDILENFERAETVEPESIARLRNITPSTVVTIVNSMTVRGYLQPKGKGLTLTDKGKELLTSLRKYLRPITNV